MNFRQASQRGAKSRAESILSGSGLITNLLRIIDAQAEKASPTVEAFTRRPSKIDPAPNLEIVHGCADQNWINRSLILSR